MEEQIVFRVHVNGKTYEVDAVLHRKAKAPSVAAPATLTAVQTQQPVMAPWVTAQRIAHLPAR